MRISAAVSMLTVAAVLGLATEAEGRVGVHQGAHGSAETMRGGVMHEPQPVVAENAAWVRTVVVGIMWWFIAAVVLGGAASYYQKPLPPEIDEHGGGGHDAHGHGDGHGHAGAASH